MSSYKLFVTDVDGTLLGQAGEIHPDDERAVAALLERGIPVTICTGRMYSGTRHLADQLGLSAPLACVDGSHIVHAPSGRDLWSSPLGHEAAVVLLEVLGRFRLASFAFSDDRVFHESGGEQYAGYVSTWSERLHVVADLLHDVDFRGEQSGVTALVALGQEHDVTSAKLELEQRASNQLQVVAFPAFRASRRGAGITWGMIIRAGGVDKGTAIEWLSRHYGIAPEEVVVVGDWLNDVPMMRRAGLSFAMGQAPDEVKAAASSTLESDSLSGGGLAEAARRAGLL